MCDHHVGGTSYLGDDNGEGSSDDSDSNILCAQGGETDKEGSEDGPCYVDLNKVPAILEEDLTQFERFVT